MKKHLPGVAIAFALTLLSTSSLFSQEVLVKDLNITPGTMRPIYDYTESFCKCGQYLYFVVPFRELWRTDGTAAGTIPLGDINKGYANAPSGVFECAENKLYFNANDGTHGWELWTSDGSPAGTKLVKDVTPDSVAFLNFLELGAIGDTFIFFADSNNDKVFELWKSKGTENTTQAVTDFPGFSSPPGYVISSDTHIFFHVRNPVTNKIDLWVTDGTGANTIKIRDDFFVGSSRLDMGAKVMFTFTNPSNGANTVWVSDGTASGTVMVKDFGSQPITSFQRFLDKLIFSVDRDTWISTGTEAGTTFLISGQTRAGTTIGNEFYGVGYDFSSGLHRLYKTNGATTEAFNLNSAAGIPDISMNIKIPVLGDKLILQYFDDVAGQELGIFNTTSQTWSLLKDINPGQAKSSPRAWEVLGDKVYFLADDGVHGTELWSTDGSTGGTSMLKDVVSQTEDAFRSFILQGNEIAISEGKLQLLVETQRADGSSTGSKCAIFTSDGTTEGTTLKIDFYAIQHRMIGEVNNDLIYALDKKFFKSNGATNAFTLVKDLGSTVSTAGPGWVNNYTLGNNLVFKYSTSGGSAGSGAELWVTDGTEIGTKLLRDINPGMANGVGTDATVLGAKLIFQGIDPADGSELWVTDGTSNGTLLLKEINPGPGGSNPNGFATLGNKVIFSATESIHGAELWITDGTSAGTVLLMDIIPGAIGSEPKEFKSTGSLVFFTAYDEERGWTLWKTNGTQAGTQMVIDIIPGNSETLFTKNLGAVGNRFYFSGNDGIHGNELWVTDGTRNGTRVIDVVPGPNGSNPGLITNIYGVAYFKANAALWRTNGYAPEALKVSDLEPYEIRALGDWVYFSAFHQQYGIELFKVKFTKQGQQILTETAPVKTFGDSPFQVVATTTSGLPVFINSSDELTLAGNTATIVKPGTVELTFRQEGDALFNAAPDIVQTWCILPETPSIITLGMVGDHSLTSSADTGNHWYVGNEAIPGATEKTFLPEESGTFKVNVTIDGCTSEFSEERVVNITAIEGDRNNQITLYPNPTRHALKIRNDGYHQQVHAIILNVRGQSMAEFKLQADESFDYSLEGYPAGIYLLKIDAGGKSTYHKFVKE